MIVGLCGLIGSGKDTAANFLCDYHGFRRDSFAGTLKDAVAQVFGWDRTLLEGRTNESREWRDQIDEWWANRLDIPYLTPRWILQNWGTEVCRQGFHNDIWIASLENKMRKTKDDIVISDVRFPNEIQAIHKSDGIVIRIQRGADPEWFSAAKAYNKGPDGNTGWATGKAKLDRLRIHASEFSWVGGKIDFVVKNDSSIDDMYTRLKGIINDQEPRTLASKEVAAYAEVVGN